MPNWCITNYHFEGKPKDIQTLFDIIQSSATVSYATKDPKDALLENILLNNGLDDRLKSDDPDKKLSCEGFLTDMSESVENNSFDIETETPWRPCCKMWPAIIEKFNLDVTFSFKAEEPGTELYLIYDPDKHDYFKMPCFKKTDTLY